MKKLDSISGLPLCTTEAASNLLTSQALNFPRATSRRVLAFLGLVLALTQTSIAAPTALQVTTTNDSGAGSLRQAVLNLNTAGTAGTISFNLSGSAPFTINLLSPLPVLSNSVVIDGTTQSGFAGYPIIELNGAAAGGAANGLYLAGGNSTVQGLVINRFSGASIVLDVTGSNTIQNNFIGTDVTGTLNRANASAGVLIQAGSGNWIGGNTANAGNVIAFNGGAGVAIVSGVNNLVRGNSIFSNGGLGIDLGATGVVLPNDPGDADVGPNNLQNYPVIAKVIGTANTTIVRGDLNSIASTAYQIDFYFSPSLNGVGFGDGKTYLGSVAVNTDVSGNASFNVEFSVTIPNGSFVSATATDPAGNTSEFSNGYQLAVSNAVSLALTVSASSNSVILGDQLALLLTLSNSGTNDASNVNLTDLLPSSLSYAGAVVSQGTFANSSNSITWSAGTVVAGSSATMTLYVTAQNLGLITNFAAFTQSEYNLNASRSDLFPVDIYVPSPATVTTPPASTGLNLGGLLNLNILATGHSSLKYQWRLNGANIPGATSSSYAKPGLLSSDAGLYTCAVEDLFGASVSQPALVTILGLLSLPASDNFASRGPLLNLLPEVCNNINATSEPGEPMHAGVPGGHSVWFTWTPLVSGIATFTTSGSSFDTLLAVYTGNSLNNLTEVASDDDSGGFYTSKVTFNAQALTTYSIAIDGAYGATGQIVLTGSEVIQLFPSPIPQVTVQPADQIVGPGAPAIFSVQASGGPGLSYQWRFNGAPIAGATASALTVKNVTAAKVGLYSVSVANSIGTIFSRDAKLQISVLDGSVNTNGVAQDKYQTVFTSVSNALGPLALMQPSVYFGTQSLKVRPSDAGGTSRGYSSTQVFNTYGSGTQTGEPASCNNIGGSSAWTSLQAADNGILNINTDGSSFNTILAVYTGNGNDFSTLTQIACNIGGGTGGINSSVTFAATSNTVYYIAVDGVDGAYGTVVLNWSLSVPPTITAQPASQTVAPGSTVTLSASANGYTPPNSQWWRDGVMLAGATNGTLSITNFQGPKCGNYQMVASNNVGQAVTTPAAVLLNNALHLDSFTFNSSNHSFQMRLVGVANTSYLIQASSDLQNWVTIATNTPISGLWSFTDNSATNLPQRFYRAVPGH